MSTATREAAAATKTAVNICVKTAISKAKAYPAPPCQRWQYINRNSRNSGNYGHSPAVDSLYFEVYQQHPATININERINCSDPEMTQPCQPYLFIYRDQRKPKPPAPPCRDPRSRASGTTVPVIAVYQQRPAKPQQPYPSRVSSGLSTATREAKQLRPGLAGYCCISTAI